MSIRTSTYSSMADSKYLLCRTAPSIREESRREATERGSVEVYMRGCVQKVPGEAAARPVIGDHP